MPIEKIKPEPMKKIKGQPHLLAYITPNEVKKLKALGGQETMTKEGIPAYPEYDNYGFSSQADFDSGDVSKSNDPNVQGTGSNFDGTPQKRVTAAQLAAINKAEKEAAKIAQRKLDKQKAKNKNITKFGYAKPKNKFSGILGTIAGMMLGIPGLGLLTSGLGSLKDKFNDVTNNPNDLSLREKLTGFKTQKEYEDARTQRQLQGRLDDMYDRKSKGKNFSQKNIDMLESQYGLSPSTAQNVLTGRDLKGFTPSRMGLQTIDRPTQTFSFDSSGMMKNQPTMMEEFYSNLDNRVTGPNVVPNASDLAIQAKTFNTPEALKGMAGATEPGTLYGTNLSDQGKALEDFRNSAVNFYNSPNNTAKTAQGAYNFMMGTNPNMFKDVKENKSFIQDAINQGFLQTEDDYANQVPLDQIDLKDGGLASMFTRRG